MESQEHDESGADANDLRLLVKAAAFYSDEGWVEPSSALDLGSLRWTPSFVKQGAALTLLMGDVVPPFLERRLRAARAAGVEILCVVDFVALSSRQVLLLMSDLDARVALIQEGGELSEPHFLLKLLGSEELAVEPDARRHLIKNGIAACLSAATNDAKGKTLEWLLHFMFSQVRDFRVRACNYRTESEELDVVIQLTNLDPSRCWAHFSAPFLIAEAKNRKDKCGQEVISKLNTIISVKRGTCKVGFVVSLSGFTSDAQTQVLKLATVDRVFVLLDLRRLEQWGYAADYDAELDNLVSEAVFS